MSTYDRSLNQSFHVLSRLSDQAPTFSLMFYPEAEWCGVGNGVQVQGIELRVLRYNGMRSTFEVHTYIL